MGSGQKTGRCRGFTLFEVTIVVIILAIAATFLIPSLFGIISRSRQTATLQTLRSVAEGMRRFHEEIGEWPRQDGTWSPNSCGVVAPTEVSDADSALFIRPMSLTALPICVTSGGPMSTPCWGGPYLSKGTSLNEDWLHDPWGQPIRYAYLPKGHPAAPNGIIVLWSIGADGKNGTTDPALYARGLPTEPQSDDIIQVVGSAW